MRRGVNKNPAHMWIIGRGFYFVEEDTRRAGDISPCDGAAFVAGWIAVSAQIMHRRAGVLFCGF
jgi:hypothetical protein